MTNTKKSLFIWIGGVIGLIAVVALILLALGYRINSNWNLESPGSVSLTVPLENATVYIDKSKKTSASKAGEVLSFSLPAGTHSILVARDDAWPWQKEIYLESSGSVHFAPFLLSKTISGSQITGADPEYGRIESLVINNKLPTVSAKRLSSDRSTAVWVDKGTIFVEWEATSTLPEYFCSANGTGNCNSVLKVLTPATEVRSIDFYKDRPDLLIFATGDTIAVIDIDPRGEVNFQPFYKGGSPRFVSNDTRTSLFVTDGKNLMEIAE